MTLATEQEERTEREREGGGNVRTAEEFMNKSLLKTNKFAFRND